MGGLAKMTCPRGTSGGLLLKLGSQAVQILPMLTLLLSERLAQFFHIFPVMFRDPFVNVLVVAGSPLNSSVPSKVFLVHIQIHSDTQKYFTDARGYIKRKKYGYVLRKSLVPPGSEHGWKPTHGAIKDMPSRNHPSPSDHH